MAAQFFLKIDIIVTLSFMRNLLQSPGKSLKAKTSPTNAFEPIETVEPIEALSSLDRLRLTTSHTLEMD